MGKTIRLTADKAYWDSLRTDSHKFEGNYHERVARRKGEMKLMRDLRRNPNKDGRLEQILSNIK